MLLRPQQLPYCASKQLSNRLLSCSGYTTVREFVFQLRYKKSLSRNTLTIIGTNAEVLCTLVALPLSEPCKAPCLSNRPHSTRCKGHFLEDSQREAGSARTQLYHHATPSVDRSEATLASW